MFALGVIYLVYIWTRDRPANVDLDIAYTIWAIGYATSNYLSPIVDRLNFVFMSGWTNLGCRRDAL